MAEKPNKIFLSYSGEDAFEAELLKLAFETRMNKLGVKVWIFQKDQKKSESDIAKALKDCINKSRAMIFLLSPYTLKNGSTQWMEFGGAYMLEIPIFVLLHHLTYQQVISKNVPPALKKGLCNKAIEWKSIESGLNEVMGVNNG